MSGTNVHRLDALQMTVLARANLRRLPALRMHRESVIRYAPTSSAHAHAALYAGGRREGTQRGSSASCDKVSGDA